MFSFADFRVSRKMNVHWPDRAGAVLKSPAKESRTPQRFGTRRPLLGGLGGEGGGNIPVNKGDLRAENAALREENESLRREGRSMHRDLAEFQKLLDKYDHMVLALSKRHGFHWQSQMVREICDTSGARPPPSLHGDGPEVRSGSSGTAWRGGSRFGETQAGPTSPYTPTAWNGETHGRGIPFVLVGDSPGRAEGREGGVLSRPGSSRPTPFKYLDAPSVGKHL